MANETAIDLDAMRQRAQAFFGEYHPTAGPCRCGSCNPIAHSDHPRHADMAEVRRDHNALIAEVERLRHLVGGLNPCPKCSTLHLVRRGFTIVAQRERYPGAFDQAPNRIVLYGGSLAMARKVVDALEAYIVAGSGCDDFYVLEDDEG